MSFLIYLKEAGNLEKRALFDGALLAIVVTLRRASVVTSGARMSTTKRVGYYVPGLMKDFKNAPVSV